MPVHGSQTSGTWGAQGTVRYSKGRPQDLPNAWSLLLVFHVWNQNEPQENRDGLLRELVDTVHSDLYCADRFPVDEPPKSEVHDN